MAILSNSLVIFIDTLSSLISFITAFISWMVIRKILKGNNTDYDFGLGKLEVLGGFTAAVIVIVGLAFLFFQAVSRLFNPKSLEMDFILLAILPYLVGLPINLFLWIKYYRLAKENHSPLMENQWRTNCDDSFSNLVVILSFSETALK